MIEKLGNLVIAGFRGDKINNNTKIQDWIDKYDLSGVILYDIDLELNKPATRNIKSGKQLKKLILSLKNKSKDSLLIAIDQEGGQVNRLKSEYGFPEFISWKDVGLKDNLHFTKLYSERLANVLYDLGINLNFAPVLDVNGGKSSFIGNQDRALSSDYNKIISHSIIFIKELRKKGIMCCGKHFPGQGSANGDTHEGVVDITKTWNKFELEPYRQLINNQKLDSIIVAHTYNKNIDDVFPASMSKKTVSGLLRDQLGFDGLIICDDPSMKAISSKYDLKTCLKQMLEAGIDLFILGNNIKYDDELIPSAINSLRELVINNEISEQRIDDSLKRINSFRLKQKKIFEN
tara:strand:- start:19167 stop:20207 length:1041 start_codon:yes stop_codon:yes gene_type:complete